MKHKNYVHLIGTLGRDPEQVQINSGSTLTKFNLCTERNFKDANGEWQKDTQWHSVTTFRAFGGILPSKGDTIELEGDICTRKWTDKSGADRWTTEIVNRGYHAFTNHGRIVKGEKQQVKQPLAYEPDEVLVDDDIPW